MRETNSTESPTTSSTCGVEMVAADWAGPPSPPVTSPPPVSPPLAGLARFKSVEQFSLAVVNQLGNALRCDQVALGSAVNGQVRIEALSGLASFNRRSPGIVSLRQAMEECLDLEVPLTNSPLEGIDVGPLQTSWSLATGNCQVVSLPLLVSGKAIGVISCRWPARYRPDRAQLAQLTHQTAPLAEALWMISRANRSLATHCAEAATDLMSPGRIVRLAVLTSLLTLSCYWLAFGTLTFRPTCTAQVVSRQARHLTAPTTSRLESVAVTAGDRVRQGDPIAQFDTRELLLERHQLLAQIAAAEVEIREGLKSSRLASSAIARAEIEVLRAREKVITHQINASVIRAPMNGVILTSHVEKRIGQRIEQGETLVEIAPGHDWELEINVPDRIIGYVALAQQANFAANARPDVSLTTMVRQIDGSASPNDHDNVFIARGTIDDPPGWLRHGLQGVTQVTVGPKPAWWVLFHRVLNAARLNFWI